ncbi:acyl-CoA synthetase [Nocardia sp. NBC_00881]|uniref:acyl-CoA synthetase n=1 Tax=Nocardia sp. NBC_00881 TaxID=2975995 RepID=UPI0038698C4A|nr:acyl-CoA synthetase [Nocardia sp. NBC_00881]
MTDDLITEDLLWPRYAGPSDLPEIESVPLAERPLAESTYALLVRAAELWPEHTAVTVLPEAARWREPLRRSFAELLGDVHRYANVLHELGVRRDDAVALIAPNCAELIPATIAAQLAGIAAPINGSLSRPHIAELLRLTGARVLVAAGPELSDDVWDSVRALAADGLLDAVLVLRPTAAVGDPQALQRIDGVRVGYLDESAAAHDSTTFAGKAPAASDLAALFHTGGTTGVPKLAAHTHAGEVANAWMIAANSLFDEDSVVFAALPLFHVNALVVTLLAPLFKGQSVVWAGPLGYRDLAIYAEFWNIVEHYRLAAMSAVPTVYAVLAQCPVNTDIGSLRYAMVGASPLPPAVRESFEMHTGITLVEGYGLTEATCASARSFPDLPRPHAVGQRMPYQKMKVVRVGEDGTWADLPVGEVGVLVIGGPTVFAGYVIGRTERGHVLDGMGKLVDGWLDTGDLAHIDEEGFIHLHGRSKDLIIRGGHNIDPAIIEDALLSHPKVAAAGAVGRPDIHAGEMPVAYVTLAPGAAVTEAELLEWASRHVPERAAAPKTVTVLDTLPVTDVGKPYKLGLRADATRRALLDALAEIAGVHSIAATVEDGVIVATVELDPVGDEKAVTAILGRYAIEWKVAVLQ